MFQKGLCRNESYDLAMGCDGLDGYDHELTVAYHDWSSRLREMSDCSHEIQLFNIPTVDLCIRGALREVHGVKGRPRLRTSDGKELV